ncbi:MAG: galactitol-1-phosphate 5-dehydrogenase [Ruminococcus sp.]|jgi:L-iditol 2-dehydrogenase|nr:galactitol-1-phosphate 5-dehydrogenase [Ruminococcus sp.]
MKSWVLYDIGDLRLTETEKPVPKEDEVLVKVTNVGICSSDIGRVFVSGAYHYPIILGHEFSGIIETDGKSYGKKVTAFPLIPCFKCEACRAKRYETCSDYSYIGSRRDGALSEYVAVPKWNILEIPEEVSLEQACLSEPAAVSLHAFKIATEGLNNNSDLNSKSIAVIGDGAIGKIIANWFRHYGFENVNLLGRKDPDISADICIEAVGSTESLRRCIENVKSGGTIVAVGNPTLDFRLEQKLYWQILRRQITLKGSWNSSYPADWQETLKNIKNLGANDIITHRFNFQDADKAFDLMYRKDEKYGKVVISF